LDGRPANINAKLTQYLAQAYEQIASQLASSSITASLPQKYRKVPHVRMILIEFIGSSWFMMQ
uniref:Transcriptional regulator n=1 Tax=Echinostoma caproni TaxID=27848 RepID=A0A183A3S1_9TREM